MPATLPVAVALAVASTCAPSVAPETLVQIATIESGLSPYAIHDNQTGQSYSPDSKAAAIAAAERMIAAGHSTDLGLSQINSGNLAWLGLSVADAFDACKAFAASAQVLTSFSRYNTGRIGSAGMAYAQRVASVRLGDAQPTHPSEPSKPLTAWDRFMRFGEAYVVGDK